MRWLKSSTPVIPMQTGMADVPTVLTGPRLFLRSDDRHAGIKKDEQQHEAAHKVPKVTRTNVSQSRMVHMMPEVPNALDKLCQQVARRRHRLLLVL